MMSCCSAKTQRRRLKAAARCRSASAFRRSILAEADMPSDQVRSIARTRRTLCRRPCRQQQLGDLRQTHRRRQAAARERPASCADGSGYLVSVASFDADMRVSGVTFPGVPGIVLGHNESSHGERPMSGRMFRTSMSKPSTKKANTRRPTGWQSRECSQRRRSMSARIRSSPTTEPLTFDVTETRATGRSFLRKAEKNTP